MNTAARRASGEYIGRIDQDTLVGRRFLETFLRLYQGTEDLPVPLESALLFSQRRDVPYVRALPRRSGPCRNSFAVSDPCCG